MCLRLNPVLVVIVLFSTILIGCGIQGTSTNPGNTPNTAATAPQATSEPIMLPTAPPMPTSQPIQPTPTPPPAPSGLAPASGVTLFEADFSSAVSLAEWQVVDTVSPLDGPSIWRILNGTISPLSDSSGIPNIYGSALITGDPTWKDYSVSVAAYNLSNDFAGVVARATDAGFYSFYVQPDGTVVIQRFDRQTEAITNLASAQIAPIAPGTWTTLSLRVQGNTLQASVDGTTVLETTDTTFANGQAGLYGAVLGGLEFDNFRVHTLQGQ